RARRKRQEIATTTASADETRVFSRIQLHMVFLLRARGTAVRPGRALLRRLGVAPLASRLDLEVVDESAQLLDLGFGESKARHEAGDERHGRAPDAAGEIVDVLAEERLARDGGAEHVSAAALVGSDELLLLQASEERLHGRVSPVAAAGLQALLHLADGRVAVLPERLQDVQLGFRDRSHR